MVEWLQKLKGIAEEDDVNLYKKKLEKPYHEFYSLI